jgi:hypothetical protein
MIACNVVTENDYYQNIVTARLEQKRLTTTIYTQEMFEKDSKNQYCAIIRNTEEKKVGLSYLINKLTFNTPERIAKIKKDGRNIHGMVLGGDDEYCPTAASYGLR